MFEEQQQQQQIIHMKEVEGTNKVDKLKEEEEDEEGKENKEDEEKKLEGDEDEDEDEEEEDEDEEEEKRLSIIGGLFYRHLHFIFMIMTALCVCFVNHVGYLVVLLLIISITFAANVIMQNCPLTLLEERYMNTSLILEYRKYMQSAGFGYTNASTKEQQMDTLVTTFSMIAVKLMVIMLMREGFPFLGNRW